MNTTVQVSRFIYNQFPEELDSELKKFTIPKGGVRLEMYKKRTATAIHPLGNDPNLVIQVPNSPVRGQDYIRNKWAINWDGNLIQVGLINGYQGDGKPIFLNQSFINGQLFLSDKNEDHKMIYKLLHIHPEFKGCIIKDHGRVATFYEINPEAEAKVELAKIELMDKAITWVKSLSVANTEFIADKLDLGGSPVQKKVSLRKLAETDPQRVLDTVKYIDNAVMEETLNYAFNLAILKVDHAVKGITFGDGNQKVMDFNLNATDQKRAFMEVMTTSKDTSIGKLYKQVKAAVDAHATDSAMLNDLAAAKVGEVEVKKVEGAKKIATDALEGL